LGVRVSVLFCLFVVILQGCGVYSFSGSSVPPEAKTFSVPNITVMSSATLAPAVYPQRLQQALSDKINAETNLKLTSEPNAHLQYIVKVNNYNTQPIAPINGDLTAYTRLNISIEVEFVNTVEKEKSWTKSFSSFENFDSKKNLTEVENDLISAINIRLCEDIFNASLVNW